MSVDKRFEDLVAHFGPRGTVHDLGEAASRRLWQMLRDAEPVADASGPVWRISTAPSEGAAVVAATQQAGVPMARWYYDWAGGLVWLALDGAEAHADTIRATVAKHGGHATLMRADEPIRVRTPVFHPQPAALAALSKRVKASFDPMNILNRGRLGA